MTYKWDFNKNFFRKADGEFTKVLPTKYQLKKLSAELGRRADEEQNIEKKQRILIIQGEIRYLKKKLF